jgi:imidazoleglycerol-phosphate dehydratase
MKRNAEYQRDTLETQVRVKIDLDGTGTAQIATGIGFFDHMLVLMAKHGFMDIAVACKGDLEVDCHHTVEDVGISLGTAFKQALGGKAGITRFGWAYVPMDEALGFASIDISGRAYLVFDAPFKGLKCGDMDLQCLTDFFRAFAEQAGITVHIRAMYGDNDHHMAEALFKAFGRALAHAVTPDPRVKGVPSTKGSL